MKHYLHAFYAEVLKMRRTMAFWIILIAPLLVHALILASFLARDAPTAPPDWQTISENIFMLWATFTLPLLITLLMAMLAGMEHSQNQWKHLYALPIPRGAIIAAKWSLGAALIGLSSLLVILIMPATFFILRQFKGFQYQFIVLQFLNPGINFQFQNLSILVECLKISAGIYAASLLLFSIQAWVSLRWQSFIIPNLLGVLGVIFNLGMMISILEAGLKYFPWSLPMAAFLTLSEGEAYQSSILFGACGGLILALLGIFSQARREVL